MVVFLTQLLHEEIFVVKKYKQHRPLDQLSFSEKTIGLLRQTSFLSELSLYTSRADRIKTNPFISYTVDHTACFIL